MPANLCYFIAASASVALGIALLLKRPSSTMARRGSVACALSGLWAFLLVLESGGEEQVTWLTSVIEVVRDAGWLTVLLILLPPSIRLARVATLGAAVPLLAYALAGWAGWYTQLFELPLASFRLWAGLTMSVAALCLVALAWWRSSTTALWQLRFCLLGVSIPAAFDLFLYVPAINAADVDPGVWATRGLVVAASLIPFAVGAWRMPAGESRAFVSRHVVYFASTAAAVGIYVTVSLLGGFYLRAHGGIWGNAFQLAFMIAAAGLLALLLLADSPLRRLRVFISTHFYRNKYDYRVEWMRFVQTLSSPDEDDIHRTAVRAVAQIFGSSGGLLVLHDEESGRFNLRATWPESYEGQVECGAIDSSHSLPRFLRERQWVVDLHEYRDTPQLYGGLELPRWLDTPGPWRVIAPLLVGSELLGFLVLRAPAEPFSMNFEDRDLLKTLGRNVAVQLAQHRADEKLSQSRQFDAYNRLTAFVMHDLKNSAAQLQLLVANAARHRHNPVFVDDAIGTIHNTAERMTRLIEQLQSRDMQGAARAVDLAAIARAAVTRSGARLPAVHLQPVIGELFVEADPERLGAIIDHVIRNAQEATPADRPISLRVDAAGADVCLHVIDEGAGMEPDFVRERLFRPFDSTKGSQGMGIGAYQTREYARGLGGDVEVQSVPGKGTDFCIKLPLCQTRSSNS